MRNASSFQRSVIRSLIALSLSSVLGCGTILYPERRGQQQGNLDAGIVVLDAVGLLFFLVPGVVAFAVDFATGTIYLPKGKKSQLLNLSAKDRHVEIEIERYPLQGSSVGAVESALRTYSGVDINLRSDAIRIEPSPLMDVAAWLESANQEDVSAHRKSGCGRPVEECRCLDLLAHTS